MWEVTGFWGIFAGKSNAGNDGNIIYRAPLK